MKIIAGLVDGDGSIGAGRGFTVTHPAVGTYVITFPEGTWETAITDGLMDQRAAVITVTPVMDTDGSSGTPVYPFVRKHWGGEAGAGVSSGAEFTIVMMGVASGDPSIADSMGQISDDQGFFFIATQAWPQEAAVSGY